MAPRYAIQGVPMMQKQTGPLGTLGNFAMNKGLQYGIEAAVPGGGIAAEAAQAVLPGMVPRFNMGGKAPLGASQKGVKELEEARRLGALTRDEYLKALGHMNKAPQYKANGGRPDLNKLGHPIRPLAEWKLLAQSLDPVLRDEARSVLASPSGAKFYGQHKSGGSYKADGGEMEESNWAKLMRQWKEMKEATEAADIAGDMERIGAALGTPTGQQQALQAVLPLFKNEGGGIHIKKGNEGKFTAKAKAAGMGVQEYARKVLASDSASPATKKQANFARNAASWHKEDGGRIGPLSKTVHTTKDGEKMEMNFHNPLAGGNNVGEK